MSVRESIQRHQRTAIAVVCVIVLGSLAFSLRSLSGPEQAPRVQRVYFSDDDGATYFADDIDRLPPFDHDGKPAVRAHVFRCDHGGEAFVGFIEKIDDATLAKLQQMRQSGVVMREPNGRVPLDIGMLRDSGSQYKAPKDPAAKWLKSGQRGAEELQHVKCPHGQADAGDPVEILP